MLYDSPLGGTSLEVSKYYNDHYSYYRMREHSHRAFEIMYVKSGKCRVTCADAESGASAELALTEGKYIYIYGGVTHNLFVDRESPCRILNIEIETVPRAGAFSLSCVEDSEALRRLIAAAPKWSVARDDGSMCQTLTDLHEKLYDAGIDQSGHSLKPEDAAGDIIRLSLAILLLKLAYQLTADAFSGSQAETYVRRARKFIQENYDGADELTVSKIATYVCVSPAYLQRLFREYTGVTMLGYINRLRYAKARHLVAKTDLSLVDIAVNSGFGSRQRLYQVFTEYSGMSPAEYRTSCRNLEFEQK